MNNKCLKIFFPRRCFVKFRCCFLSDSLEMMAHGSQCPRPSPTREPFKGKWGHWFFPEATGLAKRLMAVVCDLRERGWKEGILMTWMNEKPTLGGRLPTNVPAHSGPWLSFCSHREVWQLQGREPPDAWGSLGDSQGLPLPFPIPLGIRSSISLETHGPTLSQGL